MPVTLRDIAEKTKLTPSAVSQILNPKQGKRALFSPATSKRVMEMAEKLGYRPNKLAQSMAKGKTYTLGLLCGDFQTPYFSELVMNMMLAAENLGYHLLVSVTQWDTTKELENFEMLIQRQVEGIVVLTNILYHGGMAYEYVKSGKFPIIVPQSDDSSFPIVVSDWFNGFDETVSYLKVKGHKKIGMVCQQMPEHLRNVDPKYPVFVKVCQKHKIEHVQYFCSTAVDDAKRIGAAIASETHRPSAVIAYSDYIATGIMYGFRGAGLKIPEDIAVVGIDGTKMGEVYYPPLTTIDTGIKNLAEMSIKLLIDKIKNPEKKDGKMVLPTHLNVRESA